MLCLEGEKVDHVQRYVNRKIGVPMVQHPAEETFKDHADDEHIRMFTPGNQRPIRLKPQEVRSFYTNRNRPIVTL